MDPELPPGLAQLLGRLKNAGDWFGRNTLGRALALGTMDPRAPETQEAYDSALGGVADFTPVVGDIKALTHDAPQLFAEGHPVWGTVAAASAVPVLGLPLDILRKMGPAVRQMDDGRQILRLHHRGPGANEDVLEVARQGSGRPDTEAANPDRLPRTYFYGPGVEPEVQFRGDPFVDVDVDVSKFAGKDAFSEAMDQARVALRAEKAAGPNPNINPEPTFAAVQNRAEQMLQEQGAEGVFDESRGIFAKFTDTPIVGRQVTDPSASIPGTDLPVEVQQTLRTQYPDPAPPVTKVDKTKGTEYLSRGTDEANEAFQRSRNAAQADIEAGNYTPFFDESARYYANPQNYASDAARNVAEALPKRADTLSRKVEEWDTPEIRRKFLDAFRLGNMDPNSEHWYAMGQLEDAAIAHLGEDAGTDWFRRRFAESMATTTSGQDPTSNLMMSAYVNWLDARGMAPPPGHAIPKPIQGQYMSGNVAAGMRGLEQGLNPATQPKGFNFSRDFMGELDRGTMDKQMTMGAVGRPAPPNNAYAVFENTLRETAAELGLPTANLQDVAWAGFKAAKELSLQRRRMGVPNPDVSPTEALALIASGAAEAPQVGKPMIRHVNESIERTSRLTGQDPATVVRRWITENAPLFGVAGLGALRANRDRRESGVPTASDRLRGPGQQRPPSSFR